MRLGEPLQISSSSGLASASPSFLVGQFIPWMAASSPSHHHLIGAFITYLWHMPRWAVALCSPFRVGRKAWPSGSNNSTDKVVQCSKSLQEHV